MGAVHVVANIVNILLWLYVLVLFARMILDFMPLLNRGWRPTGAGLVAAEAVYVVTDPPLRFLRRFLRPVRIGPVAIDFAFTVVLIACFILISIAGAFASA
ncbi:YggT family protein [Microbacterium kribbense]|uniref:YggT family protein n=1 Tax=Microbacterium kribbense TaxID=433645 RepID=A0ABP7H0B1_9MICO